MSAYNGGRAYGAYSTFNILLQSASADTHGMLAARVEYRAIAYGCLNSKEPKTRISTFDRLALFVFNYPK